MRKSYEKPEVNKVKLIAEEAVLTNCKNDAAAGPGDVSAPGCFNAAGADNCLTPGS